MLPPSDTFDDLTSEFRWDVPERYNIGRDVCTKWALTEPDRVALILDELDREVSFGELEVSSNRMAHVLQARGVGVADRVAVLLPQRLETALTHIAAFKLGAISIPLANVFGPEALLLRLKDSGAKAVVTDTAGAAKLCQICDQLPELGHVIDVDSGFDGELSDQPPSFDVVDTSAEDPALIIYTSGTTGPPKGALHAHRVLLGHLPGVEMSHDMFPHPSDVIWTPADWAWIGGLLDVLLPALHHGVPVVARRFGKFDPAEAFDLMSRRGVRNTFLPPTALKMMRAAAPPTKPLTLRTVASGGETLGAELIDWGQRMFGVTINEFYGQTECNMVVSSCAVLGIQREGAMGWPVPGHDVDVFDEAGAPCPDDVEGDIAIRAPDPVMFLGYWQNADATQAKFRGDWLLTGDRGVRMQDGALRFVGRDDDVISSAGYRIGPGEVEDCLLMHSDVAMACVVGKPDPVRGEAVVAFVVLAPGLVGSDALAAELSEFVKVRLAAHEYPREVYFVDDLPLTTTGKVMRRVLKDRLRQPKA